MHAFQALTSPAVRAGPKPWLRSLSGRLVSLQKCHSQKRTGAKRRSVKTGDDRVDDVTWVSIAVDGVNFPAPPVGVAV